MAGQNSNFGEAAGEYNLHLCKKQIMITKITHTCIYVLDQNSAYDFYVNKLGFNVHTDAPMGEGARWLTVTPPEQPELEITLFPVAQGAMFDSETVQAMTTLIKKGTFGAAVFTCIDLLATYEELQSIGVVFKKPPTKEFYGFEALFIDDSGNWFSLAQINS
jgi:catechol 2,3-dioxygenase-like lactoylglutathione lyase family enzyme